MPEQEKTINKEGMSETQDFAEKLKNSDSAATEKVHDKSELEKIIKRNQERVHKSEATHNSVHEEIEPVPSQSETAIDKVHEIIETTPPLKKVETKKDEEQKEKKQEEQQKEHVKFHAKDIALSGSPDDQISKIVDLASKKDPYFAIKVAKHIDNNYILDRVHDQLTEDQVRKALIEKGLLENLG